ncbi:MAG: SRPBCC family protein [Gammaproteobacteria bacterium]|nr:SRPBCC family protein [Gammaproteobacteria bacterium]
MDINRSAPAVATHELLIHAPAQKIWSLISEIDHWPSWNPVVKSAKLNGAFDIGTTFNWKSGGISIISTLQEIQPTTKLVWTGKAIGTRAVHVWFLQAMPDGILVRTSESFEGWLVSLMRKSMQKTLDESLVAWLNQLKHQAED